MPVGVRTVIRQNFNDGCCTKIEDFLTIAKKDN
jgi:hypothetical protein